MNEQYDNDIKDIEKYLRRICFQIKKKGREILCDYDITPPQFNALQNIICKTEMTIGELSNALYLAPSTITDLVDRMEKNNLVERIRDTKDRRVVKVTALPKGIKLIDEVMDIRCQFISNILKDLDSNGKKELIKYLEIFIDSDEFTCSTCK